MILHFYSVRPKIRAIEQLLAVSKEDNVTLECQIEASPKPFVSWIRQDQLILLPARKYIITETINSYKTNIRLKIIRMEDKDFGTYKCVAKNTLGESEGYIRVHGKCYAMSYGLSILLKYYTFSPVSRGSSYNCFTCACSINLNHI